MKATPILILPILSLACMSSVKESTLNNESDTSTEEVGSEPSGEQNEEPSNEPTDEPSSEPADEPSGEPAGEPGNESGDDEYPSGPYGWNPSMEWGNDGGAWTTNGDIMENICLPRASGGTFCLEEAYKNNEFDVIFVDFSAMWCGPCQSAASGEREFSEYLEANGWKPLWVTILLENNSASPPSASDGMQWANQFNNNPDYVLLGDYSLANAVSAGFPSIYIVHNSNMLIWDVSAGWLGPNEADWAGFISWYANDLLPYCAAQPGAID